MLGDLGRVCSPLPSCFAVFQRKFQLFSAVFRMFSISLQPISCWLRGFFAFCSSFQFIFMFSILAAEQTDRLEKSIRKVVREELQAVNITSAVPSPLPKNAIPDSALDFLNSL